MATARWRLVGLFLAAVHPAIAFSPPSQSGAIAGQVVDAQSGAPVGGSQVTLTAGRPPSRTVLTDRNGRFVFADLDTGVYWLSASKAGYCDGALGQRFARDSQQPLELVAGAKVLDLKLRVWNYAVISGAIRDSSGEPVIGATILALRRISGADGTARFAPTQSAVTDDRGEYRLFKLVPGSYAVGLLSTSLLAPEDPQLGQPPDAIVPTVFWPAAISPTASTLITLESGELRAGVDFRQSDSPGATVSGTVTAPAAQARTVSVSLLPVDADGTVSDLATAVSSSQAQHGTFRFAGVPPGQYRLRIVDMDVRGLERILTSPLIATPKIRLTSRDGSVAAQVVPPGTTLWADEPITVEDVPLDRVSVVLKPGLVMSGHVVFKRAPGKPPPGKLDAIRVIVESADGRQLANSPITRLSVDGGFETVGFPPGRYVISVKAPPEWSLLSVSIGGRLSPSAEIEVGDQNVPDVVVTLTDRPAGISGDVMKGDRLAPGVSVYLFPADSTRWRPSAVLTSGLLQARTAASGMFRMANLPPGDYLVAADDSAAEFWTDPAFLRSLVARAEKVHIAEGDHRVITLRVPPGQR